MSDYRPVVLVHGLLSSRVNSDGLMARLAPRWTVVDEPGRAIVALEPATTGARASSSLRPRRRRRALLTSGAFWEWYVTA